MALRTVDIATLLPRRGDRVFIAGQTGSGKTKLAEVLLRYRKYVVVLDVKGTINWRGYTLVKSYAKLLELDPKKSPRIIYRPNPFELDDEVIIEAFFKWIYERHNTTVYVDELFGIAKGGVYPKYYGACLTRGRELKIEVWTGSQRPKDIPQIAISEAEHCYIFFLKLPQDRVRIEQITAINTEAIAALPKRHFLYAPQQGAFIGPQTLLLT